jgi:serine/threonine protein phosphatase PrpC
VASDGVWEFISNEQAVEYAAPFFEANNPDGACEKLVREAHLQWKKVSG